MCEPWTSAMSFTKGSLYFGYLLAEWSIYIGKLFNLISANFSLTAKLAPVWLN